MRRDGYVVNIGHIGNAPPLEQATHFLEIRRQDVHRLTFQELAEGGGHVNTNLRRGEAAPFHRAGGLPVSLRTSFISSRLFTAVKLRSQLGPAVSLPPPSRGPRWSAWQQHGRQARQPLAGMAIGVDADAVAVFSAQELVDGEASRLPDNVPKRRLDPADGVVAHSSGSRRGEGRPHQAAKAIDVTRIFAR